MQVPDGKSGSGDGDPWTGSGWRDGSTASVPLGGGGDGESDAVGGGADEVSAIRSGAPADQHGREQRERAAHLPTLLTLREEITHPDVVHDPVTIEEADEPAVAHDREHDRVAEALERLAEIVVGPELGEAG